MLGLPEDFVATFHFQRSFPSLRPACIYHAAQFAKLYTVLNQAVKKICSHIIIKSFWNLCP